MVSILVNFLQVGPKMRLKSTDTIIDLVTVTLNTQSQNFCVAVFSVTFQVK